MESFLRADLFAYVSSVTVSRNGRNQDDVAIGLPLDLLKCGYCS